MPKIEAIYALASIDEGPEDEGVVAARGGDSWMPLVGADEDRVESLRPLAMAIPRTTGKRIVLARFKNREDLEELKPQVL